MRYWRPSHRTNQPRRDNRARKWTRESRRSSSSTSSTSSSSSGTFSDSLSQEFGNLNEGERLWMEQCDFPESRGYLLRPRFRPGWVPSWRSTGQNPFDCEDSRFHPTESVIDATRLSDGRQVSPKIVRRDGDEVRIAMMLSSPEALQEPFVQNSAVSEVLDPVKRTLEGLTYMHQRRVAHRHLTDADIMLDARDIFPDGFHPDQSWSALLPNRYADARYLRRSDVKTIKYYFIDFDISSYFEDPVAPRLVTGLHGRDQQVPELDTKKPYDPFAVDVCTLGNVHRKLFRRYRNFNFLYPLVEQMTNKHPEERPVTEESLAFFHQLVDRTGSMPVDERLRPVNEPIVVLLVSSITPINSVCIHSEKHHTCPDSYRIPLP